MNTSQLKSFAQESRKSLMDSVKSKLDFVLAEDSIARRESQSAVSALEGLIKELGREQVIEKVAYTWFNRFCALRFMDANHYNKIGIVSPAENQTQPEILAEAKMNYIDESIVSAQNIAKIRNLLNGAMTSTDPQSDAYKLLLVSYCNSLNKQLPFMFERINDYTELLMPDDLLSVNSVLSKTVEILDNDTCKDVEVIGWLYQYYISEKKEQLDYELKNTKNRKVQKEDMPAKTQLFTPKWIVSYMVENSVGKLWLESHPDRNLQSKFKYYLEMAEQEEDVKQKLEEIKNKNLQPQEIKVLDPACGSGHILVKAFDVLFEIYKSQGWQDNEIPELILRNNLYGLDICDRAAQLAQFAVMMKARQFDRTIFNKVTELNICSIKDTDWIDYHVAQELLKGVKDEKLANEQIKLLQETFKDVKEYGSIIDVKGFDFDFWQERIDYFNSLTQSTLYTPIIRGRLRFSIKQAKIMQQKYESIITNPPYLGSGFFDANLTEFMKKHYPNSKSDLCVAFIEKLLKMTQKNCYCSLVTMQSWMFLSSFEAFRENLLNNATITTMTHMGNNVMRIAFGTCATVWKKILLPEYKAIYSWVENDNIDENEEPYIFPIKDNGRYSIVSQNGFHSIPSSPIAYWASDKIKNIFAKGQKILDYGNTRKGMATGLNEVFVRNWYELIFKKIGFNVSSDEINHSPYKWYPYANGGEYRKWYGNYIDVVLWENNGHRLKTELHEDGTRVRAVNLNLDYILKQGLSWTSISSNSTSMRILPQGFLFSSASNAFFGNELIIILGYLNSKLSLSLLKLANPTLNANPGNIANLPFLKINNIEVKEVIENKVLNSISISKDDWDSFETSWDFKVHPLLRFANIHKGLVEGKISKTLPAITDGDKVEECFKQWKSYKQEQFNKLKANEEELNRLFIEIYGLQDEMTPEVDDKDITVALADEKREIKSLLSYAVGCMFGRYSLDEEGLVYAGGEFDKSRYEIFPADDDAVIPVLAEHLFTDDVTSRFKEFLKVAFGEKYFDENLEYVAKVLGKKNTETADDTIRSYFMKDFYNDHLKTYQKRPIYWMFSSPKGNFNALVYMHRYNKDTASVILNTYLRNYRDEKLKAKIENCKQIELSGSSSQSDKIKAQKQREEMEKIVKEVSDWEHDVLYPLATERKEIDLDDGVKVNYLKFGKALKDFGLKAK